MPLDAGQRAELERLLERDRDRLVRRLQRFGASRDEAQAVVAFSQHMAEAAADLTQRETAYLLASQEGLQLVAVSRALERLGRDPASFGLCRECGAAIDFARLEAVPHTEVCIECKRAEEERGSGSGD